MNTLPTHKATTAGFKFHMTRVNAQEPLVLEGDLDKIIREELEFCKTKSFLIGKVGALEHCLSEENVLKKLNAFLRILGVHMTIGYAFSEGQIEKIMAFATAMLKDLGVELQISGGDKFGPCFVNLVKFRDSLIGEQVQEFAKSLEDIQIELGQFLDPKNFKFFLEAYSHLEMTKGCYDSLSAEMKHSLRLLINQNWHLNVRHEALQKILFELAPQIKIVLTGAFVKPVGIDEILAEVDFEPQEE
jgi:hypothetical protein